MSWNDEVLLLVDDKELVRTACAQAFEEWGCTVIQASTCEQALILLDEHPEITCVLTDEFVNTSTMTGSQLIEVIQQQNRSVRLAIYSGTESVSTTAQNLGVLFFLKPTSPGDILNTLCNQS